MNFLVQHTSLHFGLIELLALIAMIAIILIVRKKLKELKEAQEELENRVAAINAEKVEVPGAERAENENLTPDDVPKS